MYFEKLLVLLGPTLLIRLEDSHERKKIVYFSLGKVWGESFKDS